MERIQLPILEGVLLKQTTVEHGLLEIDWQATTQAKALLKKHLAQRILQKCACEACPL